MLKQLRIFLILNILAMIVTAILAKYYDPTASPLISQVTKIQIASVTNTGLSTSFSLIFGLVEFVSLIYSFVALWIGHRSGKWVFLGFLFLGCTDYYFVKIVALSWITMCIANFSMLLSGIILAIAFGTFKSIKI